MWSKFQTPQQVHGDTVLPYVLLVLHGHCPKYIFGQKNMTLRYNLYWVRLVPANLGPMAYLCYSLLIWWLKT